MNIIELKNVTKIFKEKTVINNLSIAFESGKIHGLIGRNGSGKTVLLKLIIGFILPTNGEVKVNGKIIGKDVDFAENIGVIIETPGFNPHESAFDNLKYLSTIKKVIGEKEIIEAIEKVGLNPKEKKHVGKYSLGMRQRLGLAQAIMENPDLLILDEPMNGLDKDGVVDMRKYLLDLKEQGKTILVASHSTEDIEVLCDTVCEMDKGILRKVEGWELS